MITNTHQSNRPVWMCSQIGAREHYAVPRGLHQEGRLGGLITDWYAPRGTMLRWFGRRGRAALTARSEGIPDGLIRAFHLRSLWWKWKIRRSGARGQVYEALNHTDAAFAGATARLRLPAHQIFFGYSFGSLEMLAAEKKRGVFTVLDQIDPGAGEFRLVAEEMKRFKDLAGAPPKFPTDYYERNQNELALADRVVVNSEFCRQTLVEQGVPPGKLVVIPLCYEPHKREISAVKRTWNPAQPLRVLFLGQVIVRKGIHYLMAAARKLEKANVHFHVVGPVGISAAAVNSAPRNITFHGRATRDQAGAWYQGADLFVLPTLSDGFAITQLEAMSYGLPVITTPCCGDVVSEGLDGFIVPPRNSDALANVLLRYLTEPELLLAHQQATAAKSGQFTLQRLAKNLLSLETGLLNNCQQEIVPAGHQ